VDGIEPPATQGLRLQRRDGTSLSLLALPVVGRGSRGRTALAAAYETARITNRSTRIDWRMVKESNHQPLKGWPGFQDRLRPATRHHPEKLAVAGWFEHPASRIGTVRSVQLSYATF
jgi:hypothetical protein